MMTPESVYKAGARPSFRAARPRVVGELARPTVETLTMPSVRTMMFSA